ncbi:MAG TPA: helix-turn-helix domain-containing protein [Thermoleophilaceae bacterium]|jgi:CRP-like cAMP-binding protein
MLSPPPNANEVRVLEADPDLAGALAADQIPIATQRVCARTEVLAPGLWTPRFGGGRLLGLLVLEGMICRSVEMADRSSAELLGGGDLLRPWRDDAVATTVPSESEWRVLEPTTVAILGERFARAIAPWPELTAELLDRAIRRSRSQAAFAAISHMTRVDVRLLLAFWHFAERWGRVTPDGVVVRLPITHETLGTLIGARRPSVTTGLGVLADDGLVRPLLRGEWLLTHRAAARVDTLGARAASLAA